MNIKSLLIGSAAALACIMSFSAASAEPGGGGCMVPNQSVWHQSAAPQCDIPAQPAASQLLCEPAAEAIVAKVDDTILIAPQLAQAGDIAPFVVGDDIGFTPQLTEGDGGMKKPIPPSDRIGYVTASTDPWEAKIARKTTSI